METWEERFKRGQGLTVGSLAAGDVFRIGNRIGTVLYLTESRARVRFRGNPARETDIAPGTTIDELFGKENKDMQKRKTKKTTAKSDRLREMRESTETTKAEEKKRKAPVRAGDIPLAPKTYHGVMYEVFDDTKGGMFRVRGSDGYDQSFPSLTAAAKAGRSKHNPKISESISGPAFWGLRK